MTKDTDKEFFPELDDEQIECLYEYGVETRFETDDRLFVEGTEADCLFVLLEGEVRIVKRAADGEVLLAVHGPGHFTGEIALLTGGPCIATGIATLPSRALRIDVPRLRNLLSSCPSMAEVILPALAGRRQESTILVQHREKLAALGKLSAGLAHELNNPAAAAKNAATHLSKTLAALHRTSVEMVRAGLTTEQWEIITDVYGQTAAGLAQVFPLDPLAQSDLESAMIDLLEETGVAEPWNLAPTLISAGVTLDRLTELKNRLGGTAFISAVQWLEASLCAAMLVSEIDRSTTSIARLVKAIKSYTFMDQAPKQEVDIHEGLDNTLTMLGHKLKKGVVVHREYCRDVPKVCAHGGELNQVWTNLIDNSIDAMDGKGDLRIRTHRVGGLVEIHVTDSGHGIPPDITSRIFEPFFTTKDVGKGSGLGLDIAYRIVRKHNGEISVASEPGKTTFTVRLPLSA